MNFKYNLDKSSKKFRCPGCGNTTFVRFIDNETGHYLIDRYGRCDRESKCKYHYPPPKGKKCYLIAFLSIQDISEKSFKATESNGNLHFIPKSQVLEMNGNNCWITEWWLKANNISYLLSQATFFGSNGEMNNAVATVATAFPVAPVATACKGPEKISLHSWQLMDQMYNKYPVEDNLLRNLKSLFSEDQVLAAMQNYFLTGTNLCWNGATVFWQIDDKEKIHGGKIMLYDPSNGKRIKKPYNHINWLHKALKESDFLLSQCLFGLHRIREDYNKPIAIVESEKTAIIMSIIVPEVIWIATGSKQNLKAALMEPLKSRKIVLYPDKGEYGDWMKKAELLKGIGLKIEVSDILENTNYKEGTDLADYYLGEKNK